MIYAYRVNELPVQTGDLVCTTDGGRTLVAGEFWRLIGKLVPGEVDHIAVYVGPAGRCVEAGPVGVYTFDVEGGVWAGEAMRPQRLFIDTLYGVAYPLEGRGLSEERQRDIRAEVASYCLAQAAAKKPYNLNFLDPHTEEAFYCSQLAYKAYLRCGIDLNTGLGIPHIPGAAAMIFPQEIWSGCSHKRAA